MIPLKSKKCFSNYSVTDRVASFSTSKKITCNLVFPRDYTVFRYGKFTPKSSLFPNIAYRFMDTNIGRFFIYPKSATSEEITLWPRTEFSSITNIGRFFIYPKSATSEALHCGQGLSSPPLVRLSVARGTKSNTTLSSTCCNQRVSTWHT